MKRVVLIVFVVIGMSLPVFAAQSETTANGTFLDGIRAAVRKHLGRPYVWGASGMKSFDCSGFVWRVMFENGILLKRTTARKFYMMLPKAMPAEQTSFGTLVFFDDLKHVGMIDDANAFYHAQVSIGTNRSPMNSYWRPKIYGYRKLPLPQEKNSD